ncbi:MAG TPA: prolyl oligopeptidase family serine peptidase [Egibacteraceae bacterium]|nr:prolyl oligopeptidase family serine peptidase [Egibacteraceae bacterium]
MDYPHTPTVDQVDDYHGTKVADPYRWLEDPDTPEARAWIAEQNRLTQAWLEEVAARPRIRARLAELWDHPRAGAPWRRGAAWFQMRNTGLQNQDVLWVLDAADGHGRVLLDPNELSPDGTVALAALAVSDDGGLLAYATSAAGSDWMTWRVRDVATGADHPDELHWSKFAGAAWAPDASGFFYARFDPPAEGRDLAAANRGHQLRFHRLGDPQDDDALVYARPDRPDWMFSPMVTEDGRWLVVHISEGTDPRGRVWVRELGVDAALRPLLDDFDAAYDVIGVDGDDVYVLTDRDAPRGRIVALDVRDPARWREVVAESEDTLEHARLVGRRLVVVRLHHARNRLRLHDLDGTPGADVALPDIATVSSLTGRAGDDGCHVGVVTYTQPQAIYRIDVASEAVTLVRPPALDVDAGDYVAEQVFVDRPGGVAVPMFLVRRADVTGDAPVRLYGYGGFSISLTPGFTVANLVWLERGGVLAVANLRGGGEYGRQWHDAGRLANKQTVFDDAIACAEWLVATGWTRTDRLAIQGGSNGGLLAAACLVKRPDLFGACVPEVGVLDMLRFHRFTIGWAWTSDYGSPDDPEQFAWLHAYSPLHNLVPGTRYPATLVVTGDHDDRVVPAHSFKFTAALQAAQADDGPPVLIRVETDAGHGAGKPTAKLIDERADVLAFLVRALDMEGAAPR